MLLRSPAPGPRRRVALVPPLLLILGALAFSAILVESPARGRAAAPLLFSGARLGDFPTVYAAPGAITEVPDPVSSGEEVLSFDVRNRDVYPITPTENPRAILASPNFLRPGEEIWLATRFLVPRSYPVVPRGGWVSLLSFYGPPFDSSSPVQLELSGRDLQWERNRTYGFDSPFRQPLAKGRWTSVLLHERFARHGFVELWVDGRQIEFFDGSTYNPHRHAPTRRLKMATRDRSNDTGPNSARIGQYRKANMFKQATIYFGGLRVGRTRASVE